MNCVKYLIYSIVILAGITSCDSNLSGIDNKDTSSGFYLISDEDLIDSIWDCGIVNENGDFILLTHEDKNKIAIFNSTRNDHPLLVTFNENNDIIGFMYDNIHATINVVENQKFAIVKYDEETSIIPLNDKPINRISNNYITKSSETNSTVNLLFDMGKFAFEQTTAGGLISLTINAAKGKDISLDLDIFAICQFIGTKSNLAALLVGIGYEMYKDHKEYLQKMDLYYFGDSKISIDNIIKEEDDSWSLTIRIKELPNITSTFEYIKVGVLVSLDKEKLAHPKGHGNDAFTQNDKGCWIIDERNIDHNFTDTDFNISVDIYDENQKVYYARPYMITYVSNGLIDIESDFLRYGEIIELSDRWVDLGLPSGILWAKYNVGASSPEEYGDYYAWGETETKSSYGMSNYNLYDLNIDISNTKYDVATQKWGNGARIPSLKDFKELLSNCSWYDSSYNGIRGYYAKGPNGNQIFFPFSGYKMNSLTIHRNYAGCFWSSTPSGDLAYILECFSEEGLDDKDYIYCYVDKDYGMTVRPVKDKN